VSAATDYDPKIIEAYAARLYRRAATMGVGAAVTGAVVGAFFGAIPLTSLGDTWPIPSAFGFATMLIGVVAGALIGWVIGDARAFGYRLQAQSALCQLQSERNTAAVARAIDVRRRAPAPAGPAPTPLPVPAAPPVAPPVATPAPPLVPLVPTAPPAPVTPPLSSAPDHLAHTG
jgi:hypothetical protein